MTIITSPDYVLPAMVLMYSIALTRSPFDRVICVTAAVPQADRKLLALYAQIVEVESVPPPLEIEDKHYKGNPHPPPPPPGCSDWDGQ